LTIYPTEEENGMDTIAAIVRDKLLLIAMHDVFREPNEQVPQFGNLAYFI
jgi:hypothetical protein